MASRQVRLVAAVRHYHGGRLLRVGQEFSAPEDEAKDLIALRFADLAPARERRAYKRRDLVPEE